VLYVQEKNLDWFPRMIAMSLAADDAESEQNELRNLQMQLAQTNELVENLSKQLSELKEQVTNHLSLMSFKIRDEYMQSQLSEFEIVSETVLPQRQQGRYFAEWVVPQYSCTSSESWRPHVSPGAVRKWVSV